MTFSAEALSVFATASALASAAALAGGTLELLSSGGTVLASVALGAPTATGVVTTMGGFPKTVNAAAGTVSSARFRTSANADWKTGLTVGLANSGSQVIVSALTFTTQQPMQISSVTLSHSAVAGA